jgi:hypothetical protein
MHRHLLSVLLFSITTASAQKHSSTSAHTSYKGLVMAGYQGWFNAPGDSANRGWNHYVARNKFEDGNCKFDMWPDTREYKITYESPFTLSDGSTAKLFSSYDASTVDLHFKWMKQYGLDGVFVQRFVSNLKNPRSLNHNNVVLANALKSARKYDRAIGVMYDLSGMKPGDGVKVIIEDWKALVDKMNMTTGGKKQPYIYHNGKPLVTLWGVGFSGREYKLADVQPVIDFLKNDPVYGGCAVMLGVPTRWRELQGDADSDSNLHNVLRQVDIVQPWFVGRFTEKNLDQMQARVKGDMEWCTANKVDFVPVIYPGFTWHNMYPNSPQNQIPRNRGNFFWKQIVAALQENVPMLYIAMFDEVDEGTAIFKVSKNPPAGKSRFVTFEEDIPEDYYLYLTGQAGRMLRKQQPLQTAVPPPVKK